MKKNITEMDFSHTDVHLSRPVLHDGKELTDIAFHWGALTGKDMLEIEGRMNLKGQVIGSARFSGRFLLEMAVRASEQHLDRGFFERMPLGDYNLVREGARLFLYHSEFPAEPLAIGSEGDV